MEANSPILNKTKQYLLELYNQGQAKRLVYHDYPMLAQIAELVEDIAHASNISEADQEAAQIAAWFQHIDLLLKGHQDTDTCLDSARQFLEKNDWPVQKIALVEKTIHEVRTGISSNTGAQLLNDANVAYAYSTNFLQLTPLEQLETEILEKRRFEALDWEEKTHQKIFQQQFYLPYSKTHFGHLLAQNKLEQEQRLRNLQRKKQKADVLGEDLRNFQNIERKLPERATQTFFRANYRNHINLSSIADNKANIMIGINAIMMTIVVSVLSYGNIAFERPAILMPVVLFLFTGLASMISAVLSARPKVTMLNPSGTPLEEAKKNIVFFGNFVHLSQEEYENAMDAMLRDSELMYGNMTRDLYHLGKVLDKKYRLLTLSYNIFMVGFVSTMLAFLVAFYFY